MVQQQEIADRSWREYVVFDVKATKSSEDPTPDLTFHEENAREKIKAIFCKIDVNEDGWMSVDEFRQFVMNELDVTLTESAFQQLVTEIDVDNSDKIDFTEFFNYYIKLIRASHQLSENEQEIQDNLSKNSHLKKINEQSQDKKRQVKLHHIVTELKYKSKVDANASIDKLIQINHSLKKVSASKQLNNKLLALYEDQDSEELSDFIYDRWDAFINFHRQGSKGKDVMTSDDDDLTDALPGNYDLVDLVMGQFGMIPEHKVPKHAIIKPVQWLSAQKGQRSGELICPPNWDKKIPVDVGTDQLLAYYGAAFAGEKQEKVSLLQRHGTVDFTYSKDYHSNYIMTEEEAGGAGGNGIEIHGFHHMDCPLDDKSGYFILGKWNAKDELHLTAFYIPKNHVLYVPPNTIHSNDHLQGRWRTMLSDSADAPIDHVTFKMLDYTTSKDVIDGGNEVVINDGTKDIIDGGSNDNIDGYCLEAIDIEFDVTLIQSVIEYSKDI